MCRWWLLIQGRDSWYLHRCCCCCCCCCCDNIIFIRIIRNMMVVVVIRSILHQSWNEHGMTKFPNPLINYRSRISEFSKKNVGRVFFLLYRRVVVMDGEPFSRRFDRKVFFFFYIDMIQYISLCNIRVLVIGGIPNGSRGVTTSQSRRCWGKKDISHLYIHIHRFTKSSSSSSSCCIKQREKW
jgi:hypothetical protein